MMIAPSGVHGGYDWWGGVIWALWNFDVSVLDLGWGYMGIDNYSLSYL